MHHLVVHADAQAGREAVQPLERRLRRPRAERMKSSPNGPARRCVTPGLTSGSTPPEQRGQDGSRRARSPRSPAADYRWITVPALHGCSPCTSSIGRSPSSRCARARPPACGSARPAAPSLAVHLQPAAHGLCTSSARCTQRAAALVADPVLLRRVEVDVVHRPAFGAAPPPAHPLARSRRRRPRARGPRLTRSPIPREHRVQRLAPAAACAENRRRRRPARPVHPAQRFAHQPEDHLVRHQLARVHELLRLAARAGSPRARRRAACRRSRLWQPARPASRTPCVPLPAPGGPNRITIHCRIRSQTDNSASRRGRRSRLPVPRAPRRPDCPLTPAP